MAELADAPDSKSGVVHSTCGFDPHFRHQLIQWFTGGLYAVNGGTLAFDGSEVLLLTFLEPVGLLLMQSGASRVSLLLKEFRKAPVDDSATRIEIEGA